jgi:hypothetical protein
MIPMGCASAEVSVLSTELSTTRLRQRDILKVPELVWKAAPGGCNLQGKAID